MRTISRPALVVVLAATVTGSALAASPPAEGLTAGRIPSAGSAGAAGRPLTAAAGAVGAVTDDLVVPPRLSTGGSLTLVAASGTAAVLRQDRVGPLGWTAGDAALHRLAADDLGQPVVRLVGTTLYAGGGATLWRTDLRTGLRAAVPLGGAQFVGAGPGGPVVHDQVAHELRLLRDAGPVTLLDGVGTVVPADVLVTADTVLVRYRPPSVAADAAPVTEVVHRGDGAREVLDVPWTGGTGPGLLLGDDVVGWWDGWWDNGYDFFPGRPSMIHVRPVAGGAFREAWINGHTAYSPVAAPGGVAVVTGARTLALVTPDGRSAVVPGGAGGTGLAVGDGVVRVVRSGPGVAGLWTLGPDGELHRDAPAVPVDAPVVRVSFAAGRLVLERDDGAPDRGVTQSVVPLLTGSGLALGAERSPVGVGGWSLGFDGVDYTMVVERWFDAGRPTAATASAWRGGVTSSGPWAESNNGLWRADGRWFAGGAPQLNGMNELFGPMVLVRTGWDPVAVVRDLRGTASVTLPPRATGADLVRGAAVVWSAPGRVVVHPLPAGRDRVLPASGVARVVDGAVVYPGPDGEPLLLDVAGGAAVPQPLSAVVPPDAPDDAVLGLDAGAVAWIEAGRAHVAPVGLATPRRPVLLGAVGADVISPDGDGVHDVWRPSFDLTKPLARAAIRITAGASVVRVLPVRAPYGAVRRVVWDGTDSLGTPVPDGTYRWTLTGESADPLGAADGAGGPVDVDGRSPAAGPLVLRRSALPLHVSFAPVTDPRVGPHTVAVRWRPVDARGKGWTYDVRVRPRWWLAGPPGAAATSLLTAASAREGVVEVPDGARWVDVSVRAHDGTGATGSWTPWRTATLPTDLVPSDPGWSVVADPGAVGGGVAVAVPGATAVLSVDGESLTLVGRRCPGCGDVVVRIDGGPPHVVRTSGRATAGRSVLDRIPVVRGRHAVVIAARRGAVTLDAVVVGATRGLVPAP